MKGIQLFGIFGILSVGAWSIAATEENPPVLLGRVFDRSGKPVSNAEICCYRAGHEIFDTTTQYRFPRGAERCRKSDRSGSYDMLLPDRSPYVLLARKKGAWAMRSLSVPEENDTIRVFDTLKPPGSLEFTVKTQSDAPDRKALMALAGTPFTFSSDRSGHFEAGPLPAGSFTAVIRSVHPGYRAVRCSLRIRSAEMDHFTDTLRIPRESEAWVTKPAVTLQNAPRISPVPPPQPIQVPPKPATTAVPPAPELHASSSTGPNAISTVSKPPVTKTPADTFIGLFDSLTLTATAMDDGSVTSMEWDVGATGRFIGTGDGSLHLAPFKAPVERLTCLFRATDNDGNRTLDTTVVWVGLLWKSVSPPKELLGRNGHVLVTFNGALWIIGGNRSDVWSSDDGITWTLMTDAAPFGNLFGHTAAVFRNRIWIIGGKTGSKTFNRAVWSSSNGVRWNRETAMPFSPRLYHGCVVHEEKLVVIGGLSDSENEPILNDVWSSGDGLSWQRSAEHAPFAERYGHGCAVFNGRIVVAGGFNDAVETQASFNDVWQSENGSEWTRVTDAAPFSKDHYHSLVSFENRLWALGGYSETGGSAPFSDILYTIDGVSWTDLTPRLNGGERFFCTAVPLGNSILVSPSGSHKLWIMR